MYDIKPGLIKYDCLWHCCCIFFILSMVCYVCIYIMFFDTLIFISSGFGINPYDIDTPTFIQNK